MSSAASTARCRPGRDTVTPAPGLELLPPREDAKPPLALDDLSLDEATCACPCVDRPVAQLDAAVLGLALIGYLLVPGSAAIRLIIEVIRVIEVHLIRRPCFIVSRLIVTGRIVI
jgi:hypothetical protein